MTYTEWWVWLAVCTLVFLGTIFWGGYELGYGHAKAEGAIADIRATKYRCYDGVVYRSSRGYWEDTKQSCKTLEQIK